MATIIDLGKLRFHFAGTYDAATEYEMNDIVSTAVMFMYMPMWLRVQETFLLITHIGH
jgi:hypothetical protein